MLLIRIFLCRESAELLNDVRKIESSMIFCGNLGHDLHQTALTTFDAVDTNLSAAT